MIIAIFSIGQFVGIDLARLKSGFQNWFTDNHRAVSGEEVWAWMAANLKPLRLNQVSLEQFCDLFNQHFNPGDMPQMPYPVFEDIFKSMVTMDNESMEALVQLSRYLEEQGDIKFLLVSHTNFCHLHHILSRLPAIPFKIIDDAVTDLPAESLLLATSMHSQAELHPETFAYALNKMKLHLDDPDVTYVSFLSTLNGLEGIEYHNPYVGDEKKLRPSHLVERLEEIKLHKNAAKGFAP